MKDYMYLVLLTCIFVAHASTSFTDRPVTQRDLDKSTQKDVSYVPGAPANHSVPSHVVTIVPENNSKVDRKSSPDSESIITRFNINNSTVPKNGSDTSGSSSDAPLNLAIIPVLAGFFIITFICIKCCNRVKADVEKDKDFIEDGKPLFRVEPDSHPDYLSSVGSGYNPYSTVTSGMSGYNAYSTVTSGYNPYNTVTTMVSVASTASETKDAGTMVKPRDIWKTMRNARGSSVPDFAREGELLGTVAEEVQKFKNRNQLSPEMNPVIRPTSPSPGPTKSALKSRPSSKPKHQRTQISNSADDLLRGKRDKKSVIQADVEHHGKFRDSSTEDSTAEECQALLGTADKTVSSPSPPQKQLPKLLINGEISTESDSQQTIPRSSSESSSESASPSPDESGGKMPRSRLRSPGKAKSLSVSFEDGVVSPKRTADRSRSPRSSPTNLSPSLEEAVLLSFHSDRPRSPRSSPTNAPPSSEDDVWLPKETSDRPRSPRSSQTKVPPLRDVEIVRKPAASVSNVSRKFSLSKVNDEHQVPSISPLMVTSTCIGTDPDINNAGQQSHLNPKSIPEEIMT